MMVKKSVIHLKNAYSYLKPKAGDADNILKGIVKI